MKHIFVSLVIVLLLSSSAPAEAGLLSIIKKILKELAHEIDESPVLFLELGVKAKQKVLEKKHDRDEEKKGAEKTKSGDTQSIKRAINERRSPGRKLNNVLQPGLVSESNK